MKNLLFYCLFLISFLGFSQENSFWNNVDYGGNFAFSFGANNSTIAIAPNSVYNFNEYFSLGGGIGYQYTRAYGNNTNIISPNVLALYKPIREIEFSTNLQQSFVRKSLNSSNKNYSYPSLNIGTAYKVGAVALGIQYDILYKKEKSMYPAAISPFIRVLL